MLWLGPQGWRGAAYIDHKGIVTDPGELDIITV